MSFCLAVVRRYTPIGFRLYKIFLVYAPTMPTDNRRRARFVESPETRMAVKRAIIHKNFCADIHFRMGELVLNDFYLWGIVPVRIESKKLEEKFKAYKSVRPYGLHDNCIEVPEEFLREPSHKKWFQLACDDLFKRGGGRYVIVSRTTSEVPRYAL